MFAAKQTSGRPMLLVAATPSRWVAAVALLALGACSRPDVGFEGAPWRPGAIVGSLGPRSDIVTNDSLTTRRVRGNNDAEFVALAPEPGNVWPAQETPRPTLMGGPEEAFRNVPEYRPTFVDPVPPARSPVPTTPGSAQPMPLPRGSAGPSAALPPPQELQRIPAQPAFTPPPPPPPRAEGRVLTDPSGRPAISTGQAGNVQGFTQPGTGGGAIVRDGNVETWIGPDGQARTRVVPPR
jgi:hypothetical protein